MKIGIDGRLIQETGVGRYIRNLIDSLSTVDTTHEYVVFLRKKSFDTFVPPNARWQKKLADVRWHTLAEQFVMPTLFAKERLDLVHIPYHNPPILYGGPMVITIHDLTILHFNTGKATTLPKFFYQLKRLGYLLELAIGLRKAKRVIAVSETTKSEIVDHFRIAESKILVTHEGVDTKLARGDKNKQSIQVPQEYMLYVGNAYPHKNIDRLLEAFSRTKSAIKLVLVGREDFFYTKLRSLVADLSVSDRVIFFGAANDVQLQVLYTRAKVLVFPSLMEGFGLPALEALSLGTPVLCSDIPIFHEILKDHATYMHPTNIEEMSRALEKVLHAPKQPVKNAKQWISKYSWNILAKLTVQAYEDSARI